ncbi:membrane protein [Stenotrophomonas maltophilia]|nr:membrane protein [Stenotrophomonas maltophilia]
MEALIALVVLVLLAIPLLLVVALVMISGLRRRVAALESAMAAAPATARPAASAPTPERAAATPTASADPPFLRPVAAAAPHPPQPPVREAAPTEAPVPRPAAPPPVPPVPVQPPLPSEPALPNVIERGISAVKRWFTEGNVPVKIGMLVLLAGVAALLKYVSDQGWLVLPIELRLAGITVGALGLLAFGWHQRERRRLFALALQGGAIGVLLLTIFAAFKRFDLIPPGFAFASSIALVAGLCVLAVVQNSRTLAVLGILAGFMAPLWLSTGSGNHVGLFSYYAVLNAGIFAIAWFRPWRALNLLGFAFTFGIGTFWGVLQYVPDKFSSTEPFLLLFFVFYLLIPLLYARRQPAGRRDLIDGSLVFGAPLVAFSLQAGMLHEQPMTLALCALGLAAIYAVLARALIARASYTMLAQSHAVLAVGFATLAVPLALSARATGAVFALEGAGLAWLGLRQKRWLPQVSGALLQIGAAFAFVAGGDHWHEDLRFLINPTAIGALLLALAGFASAWSYQRRPRHEVALVYYLWGLLWWLGGLVHEITRFFPYRTEVDALLVLAAVTAWLVAEVQRRQPARALGVTALAMLALGFPLALVQSDAHHQPFAGYGALAWAVFAVLGVRTLLCLRQGGDTVARIAQFLWWLLWPSLLSLLALWGGGEADLAQGWTTLLVTLPWLLMAALSLWRWNALRWPLGQAFDSVRVPLQCVLFGLLSIGWLLGQLLPGDAAPLLWLPVLNPAEIGQWLSLLLLARWLYSNQQSQAPQALLNIRMPLLALASFVALTSLVLHGVHQWGGLAWNASMMRFSLAQTSLTVLWSVLGVIAWVWGSRRGQRVLWMVGAVLMGVVLAKLVIVDRQHLGNLLGIASFIAYGLLCTVVGYLAPAPPSVAPTVEEKQ